MLRQEILSSQIGHSLHRASVFDEPADTLDQVPVPRAARQPEDADALQALLHGLQLAGPSVSSRR